MIFLDSSGFYALVSLIMQAAMAAILVAYFWIMPAQEAPWIQRLRIAFGAYTIALTAISVRFILVFQEASLASWLEEGQPLTVCLYGVYLAGKCVFLWYLVGGIASLRDRAWPAGPSWQLGLILLVAVAVVVANPAIEGILLFQSPLAAVAFFYAASLLWPVRRGRADVGHSLAALVLLVGGLLWLLYGVATIGAWVIHPATDSFWNVVLKFNSFWDLCLQVVLGIGLVTIMLDGSHQRMIRALRERDALRERVQQDRKLRALSMLVSGVAHEINNPLTAILGFVDGLADKDPEERRYATRVVREQAQRCRHIVKRLSVLSTTREPQRSPVDVEEFVPRVVRGLEPQFKAAGIELEVGGTSAGCIIHAEAAALEQVLTVLLVNALQATPPGGRVALEVQPSADRVTFVVEDTGPGIAAELRERVFEPFFTTKDREGTGLGLAVARTLVRAHGGRITAEAGAVGARFVIVLPCGEPAVAPAETETEGDPARPTVAGGTRMLVVDDEPLVRASIRRHARALGWQVTEADSGEIALQRLLERHERFDAVACDLRMPGLSGADVYDRIAAEAPELLGRMVFITGDLASDEARRFSERSRAPIFTKPFSFPDLLGCLRERAQHPQVG